MDNIVTTINATISSLSLDNENYQKVIENKQSLIDANNVIITNLTAELATLQAPTVVAAITAVDTSNNS